MKNVQMLLKVEIKLLIPINVPQPDINMASPPNVNVAQVSVPAPVSAPHKCLINCPKGPPECPPPRLMLCGVGSCLPKGGVMSDSVPCFVCVPVPIVVFGFIPGVPSVFPFYPRCVSSSHCHVLCINSVQVEFDCPLLNVILSLSPLVYGIKSQVKVFSSVSSFLSGVA